MPKSYFRTPTYRNLGMCWYLCPQGRSFRSRKTQNRVSQKKEKNTVKVTEITQGASRTVVLLLHRAQHKMTPGYGNLQLM
jgi:hypothetical protein